MGNKQGVNHNKAIGNNKTECPICQRVFNPKDTYGFVSITLCCFTLLITWFMNNELMMIGFYR